MRFRRSCLAASAGLVVLFMAAPGPTQSAPPEPQAATILFRALLADGRPFADVRAQDVELKVDGRVRTLRSLTFVRPGSGEAAGAPPEVPPPFATNLPGPALRDTIFVFEDESIAAGMSPAVKDAVRQFVGHLAPQDRVGLVAIPRGGLDLGLTADRAAFETALSSLSGRAARNETDTDAACRTRQVLDALMHMFRGAGGAPPATILFFSGGLTPPMFDDVTRMSTPVGLCEIRARDYQEVARVMLAAPVGVHVVHVPDLQATGAPASTNAMAGLEHLAGLTGNRISRLVGASDSAMAQLAAATSAYYLLTFVPEESERNGLTHTVSVKVNRPDVTVVTRPGVLIAPNRGKAPGEKTAAPRDMLRAGDVYRDFPLRAAAFVSREASADKATITLMAEPSERSASIRAAAVALYDEKGKLVAQATASQENLAHTPTMIAMVAKMGRYRLRVAATDAAGRAGTVDSALDVKLNGDGPLTLSSLVLGVAVDGKFAGRLQFSDEPTAVAYLEIYGVPKGVLSADLELADSGGGPAAVRGAMRIAGDPAGDRHVALGGIPIGALPPGDIAVRAIISLDGVPVGNVLRVLRKAPK